MIREGREKKATTVDRSRERGRDERVIELDLKAGTNIVI